MLKWTVGHRKAAGVKRSPSGGTGGGGGGGGPCYSIRRAAAKFHLSRRRNRTPSVPGFDPQQGGSRQRSKSFDKENRDRDQNKQHGSLSPRTRDSVYMRLDTVPAALRDLSNHYQTSPATSPAPPIVKRSRSRARKVRTVRYASECLQETLNASQARPAEACFDPNLRSVPLENEEISHISDTRISTRTRGVPHNSTFVGHRSGDIAARNSSTASTQSPLQIEYSPCPVRTTRSLLALRRRLTDVFVQPYHSVGTLQPPPQRSHDNPIYFALQQVKTSPRVVFHNKKVDSEFRNCDLAKSPNGQCADEVPFKFRKKDPSLCFTAREDATYKTEDNSSNTKKQSTEGPTSEQRNAAFHARQYNSNKVSLSPLSRNMASLRLSSGSKEDYFLQQCPRVTPPSPFLNSTTFICNIISTSHNQRAQASNELGTVHDVTDPRFLSLYSVLESADVPVNSPKKPATISSSADVLRNNNNNNNNNNESPHTPTAQGPVNRVLCYPEESPVKRTDGSQESVCELKKRSSLRRVRTLTSNSEEGPPVKVQPVVSSNGHLIMPVHKSKPTLESYAQSQTSQSVNSPHARPMTRSVEVSRARKSLRRCSKTLNENNEHASLKCTGNEVFASGNVICDSAFSNEEFSRFDIHSDSLEDESMLKRQGGFRRRQRTVFRSSATSDSCLLNIPSRSINNKFSGLTLPNGIPSPFSPQDTNSWLPYNHTSISNNSKSCDVSCHIVGLPRTNVVQTSSHHDVCKQSSSIVSRLNGTVSCSNIPGRTPSFGLTLSKGIPSPPSPLNDDDDQYSSSIGIAGIQPLSSSPVPPADSTPVVPWRQDMGLADENGSSSDDTWNSHNVRLTDGHVLNGVTAEEENCHMMEEEQGSSGAPFVGPSPMALVERRSRSRRCLLFTSPCCISRTRRTPAVRTSSWRMTKDTSHNRGELELAVYGNSGLLTIHVISGRNLHRTGGRACNAYVKVTLMPSSEERTFHRTSVHRESSTPWFDQKFSFEVLPTDVDKRVFVSAWHRDKEKRRSEFLGCMSFAVKHAVKKEISGSFRLLSQSAGRTQHVSADPPVGSGTKSSVMARQSDSSVEEVTSIDESDVAPTPAMERRKNYGKKRTERAGAGAGAGAETGSEDSSFLRHLELEPSGDSGPGRGLGTAVGPGISNKGGRTPFTTTRRLTRHGNAGFGFSIAWTQPPRVERVEAGLPADRAGLRPGDYVIFVEKHNVVTMPEEEILRLIRSCGNQLILEVYRRVSPNGLVGSSNLSSSTTMVPLPAPPRSSTTTSLDLSKRRLHLPQVTFSSEVGTGVIV